MDCVLSESGFTGLWVIYRIGTMRCIVFTLTFDSSPIKGEGKVVGLSYSPSPHPVDSRLRGNDGDGFTSGYLVRRRFLYLILRCEVTWQSTCFPRVDDTDSDLRVRFHMGFLCDLGFVVRCRAACYRLAIVLAAFQRLIEMPIHLEALQ